jgi:hypothetical protein
MKGAAARAVASQVGMKFSCPFAINKFLIHN